MKVIDTTHLSRFQNGFAQALLTLDEPGQEIAAIAKQPAFAIYRNGVMKSAIDALRANFPAVARLVGDAWFQAAATFYAKAFPPRAPMLLEYGKDFPRFLETFEPAADLPYLADVARLDRCWTEAHAGRAEAALDPARLARLTPEMLAESVLRPHACARWAWFSVGPVYTIWSRNRSGAREAADLDWNPEGALIVRPHDAVNWIALDRAACAFLDQCAAGENLETAAQAAVQADARTDLSALMCTLLTAGAFTDLTEGSDSKEDPQP